jgi:polysaccharide chain length determinant protein (PEP-CTERM system associated)
MLGHRQLEMNDYIEILRRRWWIILIPTVALCMASYLGSLLLMDQYTSTTLVLVEGQKVPDSYVKSIVTEDIGQRLGTMQEQILSRTRLEPIIEKFDLYSTDNSEMRHILKRLGLSKYDRGQVPMEGRVDSFRSAISVTPVQSLVTSRNNELPGFTISFSAGDPRLAQRVCSEITSMFIEENLRQREQSAVGTTDFLKGQLDDAKKRLDEQDARLADFKRKYMGSLPGNEQSDMNMMTAYGSRLDAVTSELTRVQQDKAYAETLLAQQLSAWQNSQKSGEIRDDSLERQLGDLQAQLVAMRAHYTEGYPDVVKLKEDIAALQKKIADNAKQSESSAGQSVPPTNRPEPPQIQRLRFQVHQMDILVRQKAQEQTRLKEQLAAYQRRLSMSPAVEEQYKEITRDHQTAVQFYNDLLAKKDQSEMATDLERRQQGEQFRVMDPPDLPQRPSFPNRPLYAAYGLAFGLVFGAGLAFLLEARDESLRTEKDVEHFLGLPTLASVPMIGEGKGIKKASA